MSPTWWFGFCCCDCATLYSNAFPIHCQPCSAFCAITDHMNIVSALAALQDTRPHTHHTLIRVLTLTTHSFVSSHSSHTLSSMNHIQGSIWTTLFRNSKSFLRKLYSTMLLDIVVALQLLC
jgi:hypothetical protein